MTDADQGKARSNATIGDAPFPRVENDAPPPLHAHPPVLLLGVMAAGGLMEWLLPLSVITDAIPRLPAVLIGLGLIGWGFWLATEAALIMWRAGTGVPTYQPTRALIRHAGFTRRRNPIYLGMLFSLFGFGLAARSLWLMLAVGPLWLMLHHAVVLREEAYLEALFGELYREYHRLTRRWL